jgi:hypothetical protein
LVASPGYRGVLPSHVGEKHGPDATLPIFQTVSLRTSVNKDKRRRAEA